MNYDIATDTRNIIDEFKGLTNEQIKSILKFRELPFAVLCQHIHYDFNMACVLRNLNALGGHKLFYLSNKKHYDRRGTMGTYFYTDIECLKSIEAVQQLQEQYTFIGVDNIEGSVNIMSYQYPIDKPILFCFGEEKESLLPEIAAMCRNIIHIPQSGSVRSMNLAAAATVVMYDFVSKLGA